MRPLTDFLRQGIRLPPGGWALAAMLAFYVLAGLFGRDPWKGEDAIHIGAAWHVFHYDDWLSPDLAGRAFDEPPLYYWSAALTGKLFGALLPLHEAMRLASGVWVMLALVGLYYAGRELYGEDSAAASPLLLAGCAGLLFHAHDAQPMLIALAAYTGTLGAIATSRRKPHLAALLYGLSLAGCLLGTGIAPTLPLLALLPFALFLAEDRRRTALALTGGLLLGIALTAPWPWLLYSLEPARLDGWLNAELTPLRTPFSASGAAAFLSMLPGFAFPVLPLAGWTLWVRRKSLRAMPQLLPLLLFVLTFLMLAWAFRPREIPALLLLPPLALLATPGVLSLRRGAANAFDWFAMMTFSLFAAAIWLCWSAMALGWPAKLAHRVVALRPGFTGQVVPFAVAVGLAVTLWWLWLIVTAPRSPYRSLTHWTMGFTSLWLLATSLILPWFDYGKSYRPVAQAIAATVPAGHACLAERGLTDTQRASLAYFVGIEPAAFDSAAGRHCDWLLLVGSTQTELAVPDARWFKVWEGQRPGERREKFRLYRTLTAGFSGTIPER